MSSEKKVEINTIDDLLEVLEAVDSYLKKLDRAYVKLKNIERRIGRIVSRRETLSSIRAGSVEKLVEQIVLRTLAKTLLGEETEEIEPERVKEVIEQIKKEKKVELNSSK